MTTMASYPRVTASSSSHSAARPPSEDSFPTPSLNYSLLVPSPNLSNTMSSSRNVSFFSSTTRHNETIDDSVIHGTQTFSPLQALQTLNNSSLGDSSISPTNGTNSDVDSTARNMKTSTFVQNASFSYSATSWSIFSGSINANSELMKETVYTSGQTVHRSITATKLKNAYLHSTSLISQTISQPYRSQTIHVTKRNNSQDIGAISIQSSASLTFSFSVSGSRSFPVDISHISPNRTPLNLTNLSHAVSLSMNTTGDSVTFKILRESSEKSTYSSLKTLGNTIDLAHHLSTEEGAVGGFTGYHVSRTIARSSITHTNNPTLMSVTKVSHHSVSNVWHATFGISKSGQNLGTTAVSLKPHHAIIFSSLATISPHNSKTGSYVWTATSGISKTRYGLNTTEIALSQHSRTKSPESSPRPTHSNVIVSEELSSLKTHSNTVSLEESSLWKPHHKETSSRESFIWKTNPNNSTLLMASSTLKIHNESETLLQQSDYFHVPYSSIFSTAGNIMKLFTSFIHGNSFNSMSTDFLHNTIFQSSSVFLSGNYN